MIPTSTLVSIRQYKINCQKELLHLTSVYFSNSLICLYMDNVSYVSSSKNIFLTLSTVLGLEPDFVTYVLNNTFPVIDWLHQAQTIWRVKILFLFV